MLSIELQQNWDTVDEAVDYFLDLVLELHSYKPKHHPSPPTDLFLSVNTGDGKLDEKVINSNATITIESLG